MNVCARNALPEWVWVVSYRSLRCCGVKPPFSDFLPLPASRAWARARSVSRWLPRVMLEVARSMEMCEKAHWRKGVHSSVHGTRTRPPLACSNASQHRQNVRHPLSPRVPNCLALAAVAKLGRGL